MYSRACIWHMCHTYEIRGAQSCEFDTLVVVSLCRQTPSDCSWASLVWFSHCPMSTKHLPAPLAEPWGMPFLPEVVSVVWGLLEPPSTFPLPERQGIPCVCTNRAAPPLCQLHTCY